MNTLDGRATRAEVRAAFAELGKNGVDWEGARRKRHLASFRDDRGWLSDGELMFESLADLFGFDAEEREALHLLGARAMDKGPDEPLIVNEVDVGRKLPGDDDVTTEAFKRRTVRAVELVRTIEAERGGGDMDAGGAVRQAIELLQAVESDAAELTRVDASVIASECDITRDGAVPDLVGAALGPILKIPAENAITFARFRTALS